MTIQRHPGKLAKNPAHAVAGGSVPGGMCEAGLMWIIPDAMEWRRDRSPPWVGGGGVFCSVASADPRSLVPGNDVKYCGARKSYCTYVQEGKVDLPAFPCR